MHIPALLGAVAIGVTMFVCAPVAGAQAIVSTDESFLGARLMPERDELAYLRMLRSDRTFYYLRRRAPPSLVEAVNALGEPGLAIDREPDRLYPQTSLAAHVIGYTDVDGRGVAGMERAFDQRLADPATRGQPLQLSISSRLQQALEHELLAAKQTFSAVGAAGAASGAAARP